MVGNKRKQKRSAALLGNHQRSWIWGRHAVLESVRSGRWKPAEVVCSPELVDELLGQELQSLCTQSNIAYQIVDVCEIENLTHARDHQGLAARMPVFPLLSLDELLQSLPRNPFLLMLDRIQDPYNFGSILRSADLFGVDGVIIGKREQAGISSHVARSSAGAVNYLNITAVDSLLDVASQLQSLGHELIAATEKGQQSPAALDLTHGLTLVIGNEGHGIDHDLQEACQTHCTIPQTGHIDSLNAAVAAGILCYEVRRQRTL